MAIVLADGFKIVMLDAKLDDLNLLTLHLFKNNYTPLHSSTLANFTEADFDGYASVSLSSWGTPFLNATPDGEVDHPDVVFTSTGTTANNIYGYYCVYAGNLAFAQRGSSVPITINAVGQTVTVQPQFLEGTY